jgi:hypothetical protein
VTDGGNPPRRGEDPGWGTPGRLLLAALSPQLALRRSRSTSPLVALRSVFAGFATAPLLIGVVTILLGTGSGSDAADVRNGCLAVAAVAVALQLAALRLVPPLRGATALELATSYRTRLFLNVALGQAGALVGFAVTVRADLPPWPYAVGLAGLYVGLRRTAPTRGGLARDQARLLADGYRIDLLEALTTPPADLAPGPEGAATPEPPA